ncbi:uncharacterized protein B0J16DRAFT_343616 [Fusarium flagelliforme]|uniref:uncharacterized protein n=1 Tax=Fusarium flagelliforme TaxID=2675880 RepID=UPI001E8DE391|nr:uncharacterized protein B0J16DRAFT_343616 [Fusarium flagelliforme]KAH7182385.1 hypothetical protein B0J16DRAFT_343616 [Fusarium flagelliforme]
MKFALSILTAAFASTLAGAEYTVEIPKDAVWVTSWDEFHAEAPKFDQYLNEKYGGFVVEVNKKIVLATDEEMTKVFMTFSARWKRRTVPKMRETRPPKSATGIFLHSGDARTSAPIAAASTIPSAPLIRVAIIASNMSLKSTSEVGAFERGCREVAQ